MSQQTLEEKEPGVYVRSNRPEQELDFLWDRERKKMVEHDRFHLGFFAGGVLLGSVLTFIGCFFFFSGPSLLTDTDSQPTQIEEQVLTKSDLQKPVAVEKPQAQKKEAGFALPFFKDKPKDKSESAPVNVHARAYQVQPGDTLGSIAIKFYESSSPQFIERIQRANKLTSADSLQIGQRLTIPPKDY